MSFESINEDDPHALAVERLVGLSVAEVERALILATLEATFGNRTMAARILRISLRTLRNKLALYRTARTDEPTGDDRETRPGQGR